MPLPEGFFYDLLGITGRRRDTLGQELPQYQAKIQDQLKQGNLPGAYQEIYNLSDRIQDLGLTRDEAAQMGLRTTGALIAQFEREQQRQQHQQDVLMQSGRFYRPATEEEIAQKKSFAYGGQQFAPFSFNRPRAISQSSPSPTTEMIGGDAPLEASGGQPVPQQSPGAVPQQSTETAPQRPTSIQPAESTSIIGDLLRERLNLTSQLEKTEAAAAEGYPGAEDDARVLRSQLNALNINIHQQRQAEAETPVRQRKATAEATKAEYEAGLIGKRESYYQTGQVPSDFRGSRAEYEVSIGARPPLTQKERGIENYKQALSSGALFNNPQEEVRLAQDAGLHQATDRENDSLQASFSMARNIREVRDAMDELKRNKDDISNYTGWLDRLRLMGQEPLLPEGHPVLRIIGALARMNDDEQRIRSGAAVGIKEGERIGKFLPDLWQYDSTFKTNLNALEKLTDELIEAKLNGWAGRYYVPLGVYKNIAKVSGEAKAREVWSRVMGEDLRLPPQSTPQPVEDKLTQSAQGLQKLGFGPEDIFNILETHGKYSEAELDNLYTILKQMFPKY